MALQLAALHQPLSSSQAAVLVPILASHGAVSNDNMVLPRILQEKYDNTYVCNFAVQVVSRRRGSSGAVTDPW